VSSFVVGVTVDYHTVSRGMRRQECRVERNRNKRFQQVNGVIVAIPSELGKLHIPCSGRSHEPEMKSPFSALPPYPILIARTNPYQKHVIATA
jgi:hypothetical protein